MTFFFLGGDVFVGRITDDVDFLMMVISSEVVVFTYKQYSGLRMEKMV